MQWISDSQPPRPPPFVLGEHTTFTSDRYLAQIRSDLDQVSDRRRIDRVVVPVDPNVVVARQADLRACDGKR